jgi:hypothetical protein
MSTLVETPEAVMQRAINALGLDPEKVAQFGVINSIEEALAKLEQVDVYEVEHYVMPWVIARQAKLPAGSIITTERHRHWHPFIISYGNCSVYNEQDGSIKHVMAFDAPGGHFCSLTEPETRRLIFVREETLWTTFHTCKHGDVNLMVKENIFPNNNPLINDYAS